MAINDVYQGILEAVYQDNPNQFQMHFQTTTSIGSVTEPDDIAEFMELTVLPELVPLAVAAKVWRCSTAREIWPSTSLEKVRPFSPVIPGTRMLTSACPGQLSAVAQLVTVQIDSNSRTRGRDFHYAQDVVDLDVSGVSWDLTYLTEIRDAYVTIGSSFTGTAGNVFDIGVFSRVQALENINPDFVGNGGLIPDPPLFGQPFFRQITGVRTNPLVRTQRRRQPEDPCRVYGESFF